MSDVLEKLWERAEQLIDEEKWDEAIAVLSQIIKLKPKYADAYNNRGNVYCKKKEYDKALADYDKAIELNPNDALAFNNRGNAYYEKGEYEKALADYNKAIELDSEHAIAYSNRGNVYINKGEYDKALADFNKAIELNPNDADAYSNRGRIYGEKDEYEKALADLNKAIELDSEHAVTYNNRGNTYDTKGEHDLALADFSKAIELDSEYATAYYNRGIAYKNKGEYDKAIADFSKAIKLKPNYIEAIHNRAGVLALQFSEKAQGEITLKYQEQLEKQRQEFEQNQEEIGRQYQDLQKQLENQAEEFEKYKTELLDTEEYKEREEKYTKDLKIITIERWVVLSALFFIAVWLYYNLFMDISNSIGKEDSNPFAFLPAIIVISLALSPIVWVIRILNSEKSKIWALLEDVRVKKEMTRLANISAFTEVKNKEFVLKLMDLHEKNNTAHLVLDGQREAKGGGENFVNIVKEAVKKDDS